MSNDFHYSTTYLLDKSHFSETYDESVTVDETFRPYIKAVVVALVGLVLLYITEFSPYFCWFLIALGGVEALSVRFAKGFWLARQMMSKAANNKLTLTIDEQGVSSKSIHVDSQIKWADITQVEATRQGWLLHLAGGKTYLSNRCLSEEAIAFLEAKAES